MIGGSMGGMHTLEWPLCTKPRYVKNIITIATSAYQGAWGLSWSEMQKQAVQTDAAFKGGWYDPTPAGQPRSGLGLARMIGMLTYRSFDSFEARFGRKSKFEDEKTKQVDAIERRSQAPPAPSASEKGLSSPKVYLAQSYLQYQAAKFLERFDANCYLRLISKIDTHDVTRNRCCSDTSSGTLTTEGLKMVLAAVPTKALVIGVQGDLLFPLSQQIMLADCLPEATLFSLTSSDGHDGFLIEFEKLNSVITEHLKERCKWLE